MLAEGATEMSKAPDYDLIVSTLPPAPQAWRGLTAAPRRPASKRPGLLARAFREVREHPLQTAALIALAYAISRSEKPEPAQRPAKEAPRKFVDKDARRTPLAVPVSILATACLMTLASCATPAAGVSSSTADASSRLVADGRLYASLRCASCHALDRDDFSPNSSAPPMKTLLPRLDFKLLQQERVPMVALRHGEMPPLDLSLTDKEVLVAYLKSIAP